ALSPATATTRPEKAPSRAMHGTAQGFDAALRHQLLADAAGAPQRAASEPPGTPDTISGSEDVEHRTDDANAGIAQLADQGGGICEPRMVLAREHDRAARAEGDVQRVRVEPGRRRVEENHVEFLPHLPQEGAERRARDQLLRIRRRRTG